MDSDQGVADVVGQVFEAFQRATSDIAADTSPRQVYELWPRGTVPARQMEVLR